MQEYSYAHHHADEIRRKVIERRKEQQKKQFAASCEAITVVPFRARCLPRLRSCA